jgi:hypothetical protein
MCRRTISPPLARIVSTSDPPGTASPLQWAPTPPARLARLDCLDWLARLPAPAVPNPPAEKPVATMPNPTRWVCTWISLRVSTPAGAAACRSHTGISLGSRFTFHASRITLHAPPSRSAPPPTRRTAPAPRVGSPSRPAAPRWQPRPRDSWPRRPSSSIPAPARSGRSAT